MSGAPSMPNDAPGNGPATSAASADTPLLLLSAQLPPPLKAVLQERHACVVAPTREQMLATARAHADRIEMVVTTATDGADAALIEALPKLRAICSLGVGLDALDLEAAKARAVAVSYTPDVLNDCVADLAVGLLIDAARGIGRAERLVRRGDWPRIGPGALGTRVSGRRLGILGLGRIGQTIARRFAGFDMDIRYHTRTPREGVAWTHEPSLVELARWADFLIVACAGGEATRHLVDARVLDALGPQGIVVNIARGSVIDEAALVLALQQGRLGGAALDVFDQEPQVPAALMEMDNVVLLPHIGSATVQTRRAMGDLVLANVEEFLATGRLRSKRMGVPS